jgi:hypothetical protein
MQMQITQGFEHSSPNFLLEQDALYVRFAKLRQETRQNVRPQLSKNYTSEQKSIRVQQTKSKAESWSQQMRMLSKPMVQRR